MCKEEDLSREKIDEKIRSFYNDTPVPEIPELSDLLKEEIPEKKRKSSVFSFPRWGGAVAAVLILAVALPFLGKGIGMKNENQMSANRAENAPAESPQEAPDQSDAFWDSFSINEEETVQNREPETAWNEANPEKAAPNMLPSFSVGISGGNEPVKDAQNESLKDAGPDALEKIKDALTKVNKKGTPVPVSYDTGEKSIEIPFGNKRLAEIFSGDGNISLTLWDTQGEKEMLTSLSFESWLLSACSDDGQDGAVVIEGFYPVTLEDLETDDFLPEITTGTGPCLLDPLCIEVDSSPKSSGIAVTLTLWTENGTYEISGSIR